MKNKLFHFNDDIDSSIWWLLKRAAIADAVIFLLCIPLYGISVEIALGLLLGTAAMTVNMLLLAYSVIHSVDRGSEKSAKRYMFSFYLIRFTIMGAALAAGFTFSIFNSVCTFIPLLYPKVFYTSIGVKDEVKFRLENKFGKKDKKN